MGGNSQRESGRGITRQGDVIYGADHQIAGWLAERIPGYKPDQGVRALGIMKRKKLVAAVSYERFNGVHIEASIAAEPGSRWADRSTLFHIFNYPFNQLGVKAISVTVPMSNLQSLNLATKLGFEPEALIAFAAQDGSTLVVLKQFKHACRWIQPHGKIKRTTTELTGSTGNGDSRSAA